MYIRAEELAAIEESWIEEEEESEEENDSEEIKHDTDEECSEDESNDTEEMIRLHDGQCCLFAVLKCVESKFLCEFNMREQRKHVLEHS